MITCRLQGGLGNQLFQIAATYALAIRNGDICGFDINSCHTPLQGNTANTYKDNIFTKIKDVGNLKFRVSYNEPHFGYQELPYADGLILNGYFQSDKYFNDFEEEIKNLFVLDNSNALNYLVSINNKNLPITSVHIRRGDYLKNQEFHKPCSLEYYKESMKLIGDSIFIIISDDIEWVKNNIKGENIYYSPFKNELDDLSLMVVSNNNIIANSSFSWWGAYLNPNKEKQVIVPKQWFGPLGPKDIQDLFPEKWLIVDK